MGIEFENYSEPIYRIGRGGGYIIGAHKSMIELFHNLNIVTDTNLNVLITGDTGTGKELCAQALHYNNPKRRENRFVRINCAGIPEGLLEDQLFGHKRGSFSGAHRDYIGAFKKADGGTILLDEIGDMSMNLQAKMLRVLDEGYFTPVGGEHVQQVNVRVISSTNVDLRKLMYSEDSPKFRQDLYYRINGYPLETPSLAKRKEDIPLIADYILEKCIQDGKTNVVGFSPEAHMELRKGVWVGNVRELENVIRSTIAIKCEGEIQEGEIFYGVTMARGEALEKARKLKLVKANESS